MARMVESERGPEDDEPRYVLITECLQNDFLLNDGVPAVAAGADRAGGAAWPSRFELKAGEGGRRLPAEAVAAGPLGLFLEQTIGRRRAW